MNKHDMAIEKIEHYICENMGSTTPEYIEAMAKLTTALADLIKARTAAATSEVIISHQNQSELFP